MDFLVPQLFLEERGEERVGEFRAELLRVLAAVPVTSDAVEQVLRFAHARELPWEPEEAAPGLAAGV